ncbi:hypothetical protein RLEG12_01240 (plasmid) [Rhizobium leguminosarum bv. trifolii CB782]|nr:hypothetical protein RLEG12_01240 [Rhizobium leguminosarum bv. trifolii CB782]
MRSGNGTWKGVPPNDRVQAVVDILSLLADKQLQLKVYACVIEKKLFSPNDILARSFEEVASCFDGYLKTLYKKKNPHLFFGALSWILLHEIGHVHHKHDALLPADQMVRQETQADDFATSWILNDAGSGLGREFRAMAIVTALAWLLLFESAGGQDPNHPPAILRFRAAVAQFDLGERSPAFENAYSLLKAIFDPSAHPPKKRPTPRQAFDMIAKRLEEKFPVR